METVTRYTCTDNDALLVDSHQGDLVSYEDYARVRELLAFLWAEVQAEAPNLLDEDSGTGDYALHMAMDIKEVLRS